MKLLTYSAEGKETVGVLTACGKRLCHLTKTVLIIRI